MTVPSVPAVLMLATMATVQTKFGVSGWTLKEYAQQARHLSVENYYADHHGGYPGGSCAGQDGVAVCVVAGVIKMAVAVEQLHA